MIRRNNHGSINQNRWGGYYEISVGAFSFASCTYGYVEVALSGTWEVIKRCPFRDMGGGEAILRD